MGVRGLCWSLEGSDYTGVVATVGRKFVAACKIPPSFFFYFI